MSQSDPTSDLLEFRAFPRIAQALRERRDQIVTHWEREARRLLPESTSDLSQLQLRADLPIVLDRMADAVAAVLPAPAVQLATKSGSHGEQRSKHDYDLKSLLIEFRLLRSILFKEVHLAFDGRMTEEEIIALNQAADTVIQEGVLAFVEHQGQQKGRRDQSS